MEDTLCILQKKKPILVSDLNSEESGWYKNDIVLEIGTGLGRNFGGENKVNTTGMLGIGKRF